MRPGSSSLKRCRRQRPPRRNQIGPLATVVYDARSSIVNNRRSGASVYSRSCAMSNTGTRTPVATRSSTNVVRFSSTNDRWIAVANTRNGDACTRAPSSAPNTRSKVTADANAASMRSGRLRSTATARSGAMSTAGPSSARSASPRCSE